MKWTLETHQLLSPPTVVNNKLILHVNKVVVRKFYSPVEKLECNERTLFLFLFFFNLQNEDTLSPMVDWYLESEATDILEWLCQKINVAMILNMENSVCSKQVV